MNCVPALACHFCLALLAAFTQPRDRLSVEPCTNLFPDVLSEYLCDGLAADLPEGGGAAAGAADEAGDVDGVGGRARAALQQVTRNLLRHAAIPQLGYLGRGGVPSEFIYLRQVPQSEVRCTLRSNALFSGFMEPKFLQSN